MTPSLAHPAYVMLVLWPVWAVSWFAAAGWSARVRTRAGLGRETAYRIVIAIGAILFFVPHNSSLAIARLWPLWNRTGLWILVAVEAAGFAFAWWARIHLGGLWSGSITRKEDHRIVDTGPYAIVRHPIYTGILIALFATMIAKGTLLGLIGAGIMALGFWMKAKLEEQFLREELGAEAYDAYRRRVPMLVPFAPKRA